MDKTTTAALCLGHNHIHIYNNNIINKVSGKKKYRYHKYRIPLPNEQQRDFLVDYRHI